MTKNRETHGRTVRVGRSVVYFFFNKVRIIVVDDKMFLNEIFATVHGVH